MSTNLTPTTTRAPAIMQEDAERVRGYLKSSKADNTLRAYESAWAMFVKWCGPRGYQPMPASPESVAAHLSWLADEGLRVSTIELRAAAIRYVHRVRNEASPTDHPAVSATMEGIRRRLGVAPVRKAAAVTDDLRAMVRTLDRDTLRGCRDAALLLVGFAGAFRRSELVGIDREHVAEEGGGLIIHLRRSKTDQQGEGREVGICYGGREETCPVRAFLSWVQRAGIDEGPVFRAVDQVGRIGGRLGDYDVARAVKRCAAAAGLDASRYSGHSLRAGFVTQAVLNGEDLSNIMQQTGHTDEKTTRKYIRRATVFQNNASARVGL